MADPSRHTRRNRLVAFTAFLAVPLIVSRAWVGPVGHGAARACCYYQPVRLVHGDVWTVLGSAFLLVNPHPFGPTVLLTAAVFLPYVLTRGFGRALAVFISGHVAATVGPALAIITAAALHVDGAHRLLHHSDVGMSAGLAAAGGALGVVVIRERPAAGGLVLAALVAFFVLGTGRTAYLAQVEHALALVTGAGVEWHLGTRSGDPRPAEPVAVPYPGEPWSPSA
jgi:hypothetical protein